MEAGLGLSWKSPLKTHFLPLACCIALQIFASFGRCADASVEDDEAQEVMAVSGRAPASLGRQAIPGANGVTILQVDPRFSVAPLRKAGFRVKTYDQIGHVDPWRDPNAKLRDDVFARAGLQAATRNWDVIDKDMLFLRAQDQPLERLVKNYPGLSRSTLVSLQKTVRRMKGTKR